MYIGFHKKFVKESYLVLHLTELILSVFVEYRLQFDMHTKKHIKDSEDKLLSAENFFNEIAL